VPKVYSACLSARQHHSGHHSASENSTQYALENSYYINISNANLAVENDDTGSSPVFNYQQSFEDDDQEVATQKSQGNDFIYI
jgi:hypothetical protein